MRRGGGGATTATCLMTKVELYSNCDVAETIRGPCSAFLLDQNKTVANDSGRGRKDEVELCGGLRNGGWYLKNFSVAHHGSL